MSQDQQLADRLPQYNVAAIRGLLREAFTDAELRRFCQDRPMFHFLVTHLGSRFSLEEMIDPVIEQCQKRALIPQLLTAIQQANPTQYTRYEARCAADRILEDEPDHLHANYSTTVRSPAEARPEYVRETLYSTLLPVLKMPRYVYGAPCQYKDFQEREATQKIIFPPDRAEICPFIIRGGMLFCFHDLKEKVSPFRELVDDQKAECYESCEWWDDPDRMRWFAQLLNRSLNKLTGRKGLYLDKRHRRYYFVPEEPGAPLAISYRPLNQATASRQVVWQPTTKLTGAPKPYWYHRAVSLQFHRVSETQWCLSIRPEMHVTKDSVIPLESDKIGSRVTRKKARMFNYDLLGEVQFWRDFLSDSQPRIILSFGKGQYVLISTTMMQAEIDWPGMPEEHQRPFKNVEYQDDLFSWAAFAQLEDKDELDVEDWEDEQDELWDEG